MNIEEVKKTVSNNAGKTITIASVVAVFGFYTALTQVLDQRYALAEDVSKNHQKVQTYMKQELDDKILIIDMKKAGNSEEQIEEALRERYLRRLEDISKDSD
jgi:hypothetical protein